MLNGVESRINQVVTTENVSKYRSWLHSGEPQLQAEARRWAVSHQGIVRKYDGEGYVVDFEAIAITNGHSS